MTAHGQAGFAGIAFAPDVALPLLAALAGIALLLVLLALVRRGRGAVLRAVGFALLVLVLAGPQARLQTTTSLPDIAVVLVDHSPSMTLGKRRALAAAALAHLRKTLPANTDLRVATIPKASDQGTRLFGHLHAALAGIPPERLAGVVAITDGAATDARPKDPKAAGLPAGVKFSALIAAKAPETDRDLRLVSAPSYGLVGHDIHLRFVVEDHGAHDQGAKVPVTVTVDGKTAATVAAPAGQIVSVPIKVAHAGSSVVALSAAPLAGEVSRVNDDAAFTLHGVRRRLKVLLIAGKPDQGLRIWRLLLKSDPAVQLVNFTILRMPNEPLDAPLKDVALIPFPVEQLFDQDLSKFDLIILDDFPGEGLLPAPYLGNIADWVQQGGALLAETGPGFEGPDSIADSPLAPVLPARPDRQGVVTRRFVPGVTKRGARHPVTAALAGATMGPWYRYESATRIAGTTLLDAPGPRAAGGTDPRSPLLVLSPSGKGRVAMLLSDQFWLWARGTLAHDTAMAGPAVPLLGRIVHWLLREPGLDANALTASVADHQLRIERRSLTGGAPGHATVTDPAGKTHDVALHRTAPGRYAGSIAAPTPGVWTVKQGGMTAYAASPTPDPLEYRDLAARASKLAPLVRQSGGRIEWLGRDRMPSWQGLLSPRHAKLATGSRDVPLLPAIPTACLALLLLAGAWWRER